MKKVSVCICGSIFLEELMKYKTDYFVQETKAINCSPISKNICTYNTQTCMSENYTWEKFINNSLAEWLVIDMKCIADILVSDMDICIVADKEVKKGEIVDPLLLSDNEIRNSLDAWIDMISVKFNRKIILISSFLPNYYIVNGCIKDCKKNLEREKEYEFIKKWEKYIINKISPAVISLQNFYFLKKPVGFEINDSLFEEYCYMDIWNKMEQFLFLGEIDNKPCFRFSVERYIKYYYNTIMVKAYNVFLDKSCSIDNFVLSSPEGIVKKFKDELILKKYGEETQNKIFDDLFLDFEKFIIDDSVNNKKAAKLLFQNDIVTSEELNKVKAEYKKKYGTGEKKINSKNCGYYWAILNKIDEENAIEYCQDAKNISNVLIDVFGSCVGRVCLNDRYTLNSRLVTNHLWWHVPMYGGQAIDYPSDLFPSKMNYKDRNVKLQFDDKVNEDIENSNADWLVVDLYSLVAPKTFEYHGLIYTDYDTIISNKIEARRVKAWGENSVLGDVESVLARLQGWIKTVKKKYGNKIILIKTVFSDYWIGDDLKIYKWVDSTREQNKHLEKIYDVLKRELNCYSIEIMQYFMSDECGYSIKSPIHMQLPFYNIVNRKINYIIDNQPEKKCYDTYAGIERVEVISNLLKVNKLEVLKHFFNQKLDDIVLQIPQEIIEKNKIKIASWYDFNYDNKELILRNMDFSECGELEYAIENVDSTVEDNYINAKTRYPDYVLSEAKLDKINLIKKNRHLKNTIHYTIMYNVDNAENSLGGMSTQFCVRGRKDRLNKNLFIKPGYHFIGWSSYRKSDKRRCYVFNGERRYYREDEVPEGAVKYLYPDEAAFSKLAHVDGDVVFLTAEWEKDG